MSDVFQIPPDLVEDIGPLPDTEPFLWEESGEPLEPGHFLENVEFVKPIVVDNDDEFTNSCSRHFRNRVSYLRSNSESKDAATEFAFTKFEDACEKVRECKKVHAEALVDFNSRVHARLSTEEVQALLASLSTPELRLKLAKFRVIAYHFIGMALGGSLTPASPTSIRITRVERAVSSLHTKLDENTAALKAVNDFLSSQWSSGGNNNSEDTARSPHRRRHRHAGHQAKPRGMPTFNTSLSGPPAKKMRTDAPPEGQVTQVQARGVSSSLANYRWRANKCLNCGKDGHNMDTCRNPTYIPSAKGSSTHTTR
jgi:hypothetical protein